MQLTFNTVCVTSSRKGFHQCAEVAFLAAYAAVYSTHQVARAAAVSVSSFKEFYTHTQASYSCMPRQRANQSPALQC